MYHGIINIYKEKGYTSHDVVAKLRGILRQKKIGHTGTLDPDATGVLPVCLGKATKLCDMLTDKEKTYSAVMILGKATDTQDITGNVINESDIEALRSTVTDDAIVGAINSFEGEYNQIPPMYSAIKINGKRLYEMARQGIEIERKPRPVIIHDIKITGVNYPEISMEVRCSKGTYIRTLCHDIGLKLGTFGCMTGLERIKSGAFVKETSLTLEDVEKLVSEEQLEQHITRIDQMFETCDRVQVPEELGKLLYNGNSLHLNKMRLDVKELCDGKVLRVYDNTGDFVGIYKVCQTEGVLKPEKLFI